MRSQDPPVATREEPPHSRAPLAERYRKIRRATEDLCTPLEKEDCVVQSMDDVSPTKWHLAHTSWFFEEFLLGKELPDYCLFHPGFGYLFNSYYQQVGAMHPRPRRGLLSRPTVDEVLRYRGHVDEGMERLLAGASPETRERLDPVVELGLQHEQQHQELILTDIKHVLSCNPLRPAYKETPASPGRTPAEIGWVSFDGGLVEIGYEESGFAFDNESPRHKTWLEPFRLAGRLVTNAEFLEFVQDGGYARSEHWLSDGWETIRREGWQAPLYWRKGSAGWEVFTLSGMRPLDPAEPICHVSFFEADAFARWKGFRLPTEAEWECAAAGRPIEGNFRESGNLHPLPAGGATEAPPVQLFGDVWEWTASPYSPYPGYRPASGAIGEYNGKFMCNQFVLRGGSCVTPSDHVRATYRNFFYPHCRWQFMGLRLAADA